MLIATVKECGKTRKLLCLYYSSSVTVKQKTRMQDLKSKTEQTKKVESLQMPKTQSNQQMFYMLRHGLLKIHGLISR